MKVSTFANHAQETQQTIWWKRAGLAGAMFFLVKGLLWLAAPLMVYMLG